MAAKAGMSVQRLLVESTFLTDEGETVTDVHERVVVVSAT